MTDTGYITKHLKLIAEYEEKVKTLRSELGKEPYLYVPHPMKSKDKDNARKVVILRREIRRLLEEKKNNNWSLTVFQIQQYYHHAFVIDALWEEQSKLCSFMRKNDFDLIDDPHGVIIKRGDCPEHIKEILKFCFECHNDVIK